MKLNFKRVRRVIFMCLLVVGLTGMAVTAVIAQDTTCGRATILH
jgi:hypothetical protein